MPTWNPLNLRTANVAHRLRQEHGQALVEFAVVLPVLMVIVMGIIFFGRYESYSNQMTQLAEIGARDAAVNFSPPSGTLASYIAGQATGELAGGSQDATAVSVRIQCYNTATPAVAQPSCAAGNVVRVCTQSTVQFPFLSVKAGTIAQRATMLVEQPGLLTPTSGGSQNATATTAPAC
jgi:Flp pilus assembly protein TadG